jgi:phosphoribosylformylglycinamidine cyclo-ligase
MITRQKDLTYGQVGVDVDIEAKAARILYDAARETWANRHGKLGDVLIPFDDFAGLRFIHVAGLPKGTVMSGGSDGVATKAEFAERAGRYNSLGFDLMAMVCDDAVIRGGEPVLVKSVLDVNTLGQDDSRLPFVRQLSEGYAAAAKDAGVAVINGELAQLNDRARDMERFSLDWSADVTWFAHESRLITGKDILPGDALVGLRETGLRCNGISLVRKLLKAEYGEHWETQQLGGERLIDLALQPSRIYSSAVVDMFGGYDLSVLPKAMLHGAAHITGGGIPEKLGRALKASGLGAIIDEPFEPSPLLLHCQEMGGVAEREAYKAWNMGQGMILISPTPEDVIAVARRYDIEARVIGKITKLPKLVIHTRGVDPGRITFALSKV